MRNLDGDGYSDLQECLNAEVGLRDPAGSEFNPRVENKAGGVGYISAKTVSSTNILKLVIPVLIKGKVE